VEAGAVAIGFAKEIDDVLVKLYKNAKFELDGTGTYLPTIRGHHPLAGKAFEGDANYKYNKAFAVSNATLDRISGTPDVHLKRITQYQRALYTEFKNKKMDREKLTIEKIAEIEIKAMKLANVPEDIATGWVIKSLEDIKRQGVVTITNIPWNGLNI
jgi:hypothetical protein